MNDLVTTLCSGRVLVMDGAMGTELARRSRAPVVECGTIENIESPIVITAIHQSYRDAGADVLLTNTFQANPAALARRGLAAEHHEIWEAAVRLARDCNPGFVLADVGPLAQPDREILASIVLECRDVDGVLLETWSSLKALQIAAELVHAQRLPLLVSFTFQRTDELRTFEGDLPEQCAHAANACGAVAIGTNCGKDVGMADMLEIVRRYRAVCDLPIFVKPNAGTPVWTGGAWNYPRTPEAMAAELPALLQEGIAMIGGCCGTTPEHVRAFRNVVSEPRG